MINEKIEKSFNLIDTPISKIGKIAFINSFCLGDNLIGLITAYNLYRNGYDVDVFGDFSYYMKDWFPWANIMPSVKPENVGVLSNYSTVVFMYENEYKAIKYPQQNFIILSKSSFYKAPISMVDVQVNVCKNELHLENVVRENGLVPLANLAHRKNKNRIVIHSTSSLERKNWPKKKFLQLAKTLLAKGYEPNFILTAKERNDWLEVVDAGAKIPEFISLSEVAAFIYESQYFIGNDSGIGHLASNLGIPTITIVLRKGVARQWRPSWSLGEIVLPPVGAKLKCHPRAK
jgi:hypothetical protein